MKKSLLLLLPLLGNITFAQVSLPYLSGFDTASEQNGWVEIQKAATSVTSWSIEGANANSAPNCLRHDYAPSTGVTLVDDWFISPAFQIPNGGIMDSISYMFSGFSVPDVDDTIAVYLLQGNQDPDLATKTLLFDFRGIEYTPDNTYRTLTDVSLAPFAGMSYIAIRYRNSNMEAYWLTTSFDDVKISGNTVGLAENASEPDDIVLYPNPAENVLFVENDFPNIDALQIVNMSGQVLATVDTFQSGLFKVDVSFLESGIYLIQAKLQDGVQAKRFIVK